MEKYNGQYRIPSARAAWHNYAAPGDYFITICTAGMQCLFGHIIPETAEIIVSPLGKIVEEEWHKSFAIRRELFCDIFIIMPNHLHAIITIAPPSQQEPDIPLVRSETHCHASLQDSKKSGIAYRPPRSLSTFVGGFKGAATRRINEYRNLPTDTTVWQSRFHDHIIRNAAEYDRIKQYIETNPQRWQQDKFYVPL